MVIMVMVMMVMVRVMMVMVVVTGGVAHGRREAVLADILHIMSLSVHKSKLGEWENVGKAQFLNLKDCGKNGKSKCAKSTRKLLKKCKKSVK
jgi:hypothetical protein